MFFYLITAWAALTLNFSDPSADAGRPGRRVAGLASKAA